MNTLFLITARGGSKGVPGKNLKRIGGITLIEWKIRAARAAGAIDVVCSSDSLDILAEAARLGCFCIERPADLASDTATSAAVIEHALYALREQAKTYDWVVLLEPSAPYTTGAQYHEALAMLAFYDADLVVGMKLTEPNPAFIGDVREDRSVTPIIVQFQRQARRRQDYPKTWSMNGGLYVFRTDMFLRTKDLYGGVRSFGLLMDHWHSIEIDTPEDLEMALYAYDKGYVKPCT